MAQRVQKRNRIIRFYKINCHSVILEHSKRKIISLRKKLLNQKKKKLVNNLMIFLVSLNKLNYNKKKILYAKAFVEKFKKVMVVQKVQNYLKLLDGNVLVRKVKMNLQLKKFFLN